jgi:hypothetical protein
MLWKKMQVWKALKKNWQLRKSEKLKTLHLLDRFKKFHLRQAFNKYRQSIYFIKEASRKESLVGA